MFNSFDHIESWPVKQVKAMWPLRKLLKQKGIIVDYWTRDRRTVNSKAAVGSEGHSFSHDHIAAARPWSEQWHWSATPGKTWPPNYSVLLDCRRHASTLPLLPHGQSGNITRWGWNHNKVWRCKTTVASGSVPVVGLAVGRPTVRIHSLLNLFKTHTYSTLRLTTDWTRAPDVWNEGRVKTSLWNAWFIYGTLLYFFCCRVRQWDEWLH